MAGAGYKLFTTGSVLTAAEVNTYLNEQTVMVFNDATARTTALSGVLAEGMVSYLKDTNATEVYDGSAWVGIGNSGDITAVTAGTGISGGGTSGAVTITNSMATEITASGDIIVGTGSGTFDNLPIGTTGQVLTADTTVSPYKVKWAAAGGGGANWTLFNSGGTSLSGSTTTVSGISNVDKIFVLIKDASSTSASVNVNVRFNSDSGSNYEYAWYYFLAGSNYSNQNMEGLFQDTTEFRIGRIGNSAANGLAGSILLTGCNASGIKVAQLVGGGYRDGSNADFTLNSGQGIYNSSSTISSVSVLVSGGTFDAGTVFVYTSA